MNFQSVSVGEKDIDPFKSCDPARHDPSYTCDPNYVPGGYQPGSLAFTPQMDGTTQYAATPTYPHGTKVPGALNFVDAALGQLVGELKAKGLLDSTRIIISAKHGQSPINPAQLSKIGHQVSDVLSGDGVNVAQNTDDDVALVWLQNQSQTSAAVTDLTNDPGRSQAHVQTVFSGGTLAASFGDPLANPRTPDLIVQPTQGTIYSHSTAKVAEHGGFAEPDTHVALLAVNGSNWGENDPAYNTEAVQTTQIAPTILASLGLDPNKLDAVQAEGTQGLPGLGG
jgi:arylsulfatase A-like enzyme